MTNDEKTPTEVMFFGPMTQDDEMAAKTVQELIQEEGANPNELIEHNEDGWKWRLCSQKCSTMHKCAASDRPLTLKALHDCGGKVDVLDDAGNQPMHYACNTSVAKKLQKWGADVNTLNNRHEIPAFTCLESAILVAPNEKRMEWIVQELAEWTKMGAILEIPNKNCQNIFDIFPKKFSTYAKRARTFYENYQKENASTTETFDLANDYNLKHQLSIGTTDGKEEQTSTSDSITTKHFRKHFGLDR